MRISRAFGLLLLLSVAAFEVARSIEIVDEEDHAPGGSDAGNGKPPPRVRSRKMKPMDPTFSSYILAVTASSIMESWDYSKGEKLTKPQIDQFYLDVGEVYAAECARAELPPPPVKDNLPPRHELEDGRKFNLYSFSQFKVAYRYVTKPKEKMKLISRAGQRLLEMITQYMGKKPTGWVDGLWVLKEVADELVAEYVRLGFATDGGITWADDAEETWKESRTAKLEIWWDNMVTVDGSRRLFKEYGNAQFYPAMTLMAYFNGFGVYMDPDSSNDPNEYEGKRVFEKYKIEGL